MISIIGYQKTITGFAFAGIKKLYEIDKKISEEKIIHIIQNSESEIIITEEEIIEKFEKAFNNFDGLIVQIPQNFENKSNSSKINQLITDTLGIDLKL